MKQEPLPTLENYDKKARAYCVVCGAYRFKTYMQKVATSYVCKECANDPLVGKLKKLDKCIRQSGIPIGLLRKNALFIIKEMKNGNNNS